MDNIIGSPEWMFEQYHILDKSIFKPRTSGSCKRFFCCAYREYDESQGKTGGPGGILYLQKSFMGGGIKGISAEYIFRDSEYMVPDKIWENLQDLGFAIRTVIAGAGYILTRDAVITSIQNGENPVFICHDVGSAYGAYLLGCDYVLIYHQQGSILREIESRGNRYNEIDEIILSSVESLVFSNAYKVYFPSEGAKGVFLATTTVSYDKRTLEKLSETPLYNTIGDSYEIENIEEILEKYHINHKEKEEIFFSVGDYIWDKGLDRIPEFLEMYKKESSTEIIWIAVGNANDPERVKAIEQDCKSRSITCYLISERMKHNEILTLMEAADYYIMLHRKAIFDLATLEAMRAGKRIILSDCEANREFNVIDNVVLVSDDMSMAVRDIINRDSACWERANQKAFEHFFDNRSFTKRYAGMLLDMLRAHGLKIENKSKVNKRNLSEWKNSYKSRKCIICGSGQSLDIIKKQEKGCIYIALNKALFYPAIHFDFLFMQDNPKNQPYTLEDYNAYDCVKFYGIIRNPNVNVEGLGDEYKDYDNVKNRIIRYELNPVFFNYRIDEFGKDIENYFVQDAQSVLFSALQFALFAGFKDIGLCGVEFSSMNYGNVPNPSSYVNCVQRNLVELKQQWKEKYPKVNLSFINTTNTELKQQFEKIDTY